MQKIFKTLSSIVRGESYSFFKTVPQRDSDPVYELIVFHDYSYGRNSVLLKLPKDDYFTELDGSSFSSSGYQKTGTFRNPWDLRFDNSPNEYKVQYNCNRMMLSIGLLEFSFMESEPHIDGGFIDKKCLMVPIDLYSVVYTAQALFFSEPNEFLICVVPKYDFQYLNHRFFSVRDGVVKEYKITDLVRARDGGTTWIDLMDNDGNKFKFFSPSMFKKDFLQTWKDFEKGLTSNLAPVSKEQETELKTLIGLEFAPEIKK